MKKLHISDALALPLDFVTETAAILAVKRAGKSNAAVVMAEEMFDARVPWVAIDPKGDWWGVRAAGDGKAAGLPVIVFGGEHADVPLEPASGAMMARLVATKRLTCVLDVSTMSGADMRRFLTDFAIHLYQLNREPIHLFCEEADEYIPQQVRGESARMVGAFEKLVKRGGFRGIGVTLVTQRSASLNKDVLTQAGTLIAMRTPSPQDRKAVLAWIEQHDASKEIIDQLPNLQHGEAWVFSTLREPALQKIRFRRRRTFDSGATPKVGEKVTPPATLADIDLNAIAAEMAETIERAKAEDPRELRKRIQELERQLKSHTPVRDENAIAQAVAQRDREHEINKRQLVEQIQRMQNTLTSIGRQVSEYADVKLPQMPARVELPPIRRELAPKTLAPRITASASVGDVKLRPGARRMLAVAVERLPQGTPEKQVAARACVKRSGGSFSSYKSNLVTAGFIREEGGIWYPTESGIAYIGDSLGDAPASTEEVVAKWKAKLRPGAQRMLDVLIRYRGEPITNEQLSQESGVDASGGSFSSYLSNLSTADLIVKPQRGMVAANAEALLLDTPY